MNFTFNAALQQWVTFFYKGDLLKRQKSHTTSWYAASLGKEEEAV